MPANARGAPPTLRCRYYRFTVSKPLSITTKMNNVGDAIILRNTIVNESGFPFFFEKICFVPQAPYSCADLNMMQAPAPPCCVRHRQQ